MASSLVNRDAVRDEAFLPGQIFVFGGFALRANSFGRLEQIESYAPGHQVRFGSLNYTADIRGDLIFDGFEPQLDAPHCHDGHDFTLPPDNTQSVAQVSTPTISLEPTAPVGDGRLDATPGVAIPAVIEPNTSLVLRKARDSKVPDSNPDSINPAPLPTKPNWSPVMEFSAADVFQHSPFGNMLNALKSLSLSGGSGLNYVRLE